MGMVLLCYDLIVLPLKAFNIGRPFFLTPVLLGESNGSYTKRTNSAINFTRGFGRKTTQKTSNPSPSYPCQRGKLFGWLIQLFVNTEFFGSGMERSR